MAEKAPKIPVRVQRVVERVKGGERLCKSFFAKENGNAEVEFHFEPSGKKCGPKSAEEAIAAALRYMEMATEPKRLAKAREAFKSAHKLDLTEIFHEAQRALERSEAGHGV